MIGTLLFLLTAFVLVVSIFIALASWILGRKRFAGSLAVFIAVWASVYAAVLVGASLTSKQVVLGLGQEHCFDEMCYSVQSVSHAESLPGGQTGNFTVIDVRLRNAARGKDQRPSNPQLVVVDNQGNQYHEFFRVEPGLDGEPVTGPKLWTEKIPVGGTVERKVAIALPGDIQNPVLVITEGSGFPTNVIIGDENSLWHQKTGWDIK